MEFNYNQDPKSIIISTKSIFTLCQLALITVLFIERFNEDSQYHSDIYDYYRLHFYSDSEGNIKSSSSALYYNLSEVNENMKFIYRQYYNVNEDYEVDKTDRLRHLRYNDDHQIPQLLTKENVSQIQLEKELYYRNVKFSKLLNNHKSNKHPSNFNFDYNNNDPPNSSINLTDNSQSPDSPSYHSGKIVKPLLIVDCDHKDKNIIMDIRDEFDLQSLTFDIYEVKKFQIKFFFLIHEEDKNFPNVYLDYVTLYWLPKNSYIQAGFSLTRFPISQENFNILKIIYPFHYNVNTDFSWYMDGMEPLGWYTDDNTVYFVLILAATVILMMIDVYMIKNNDSNGWSNLEYLFQKMNNDTGSKIEGFYAAIAIITNFLVLNVVLKFFFPDDTNVDHITFINGITIFFVYLCCSQFLRFNQYLYILIETLYHSYSIIFALILLYIPVLIAFAFMFGLFFGTATTNSGLGDNIIILFSNMYGDALRSTYYEYGLDTIGYGIFLWVFFIIFNYSVAHGFFVCVIESIYSTYTTRVVKRKVEEREQEMIRHEAQGVAEDQVQQERKCSKVKFDKVDSMERQDNVSWDDAFSDDVKDPKFDEFRANEGSEILYIKQFNEKDTINERLLQKKRNRICKSYQGNLGNF